MKQPIQLCLLLGVGLLSACGGEIEPGRTIAERPVAATLAYETVGAAQIPGAQTFVGTITSIDRGVLAARIDGRIGRIAVKVGKRVAAGELLLTIEQNSANGRLAEARGNRLAAAARLELAEKTLARYRRLAAAEAVTPQELDRVAAEREAAEQNLNAATAAVDQARIGAAHNRVTAPYAGLIAQQLVESGSTVLPGTPLLVIERSGIPQARLAVPEALAGQLNIDEPLAVEIPALGRTLEGRIAEIAPASDPAIRSFEVRVTLPAEARLTPGLFARARRVTAPGRALLIPAAALVTRGQLTGVYVVEAQTLRFRLVKTGQEFGERVEILSGLEAGETIVTRGAKEARSGARVGG